MAPVLLQRWQCCACVLLWVKCIELQQGPQLLVLVQSTHSAILDAGDLAFQFVVMHVSVPILLAVTVYKSTNKALWYTVQESCSTRGTAGGTCSQLLSPAN